MIIANSAVRRTSIALARARVAVSESPTGAHGSRPYRAARGGRDDVGVGTEQVFVDLWVRQACSEKRAAIELAALATVSMIDAPTPTVIPAKAGTRGPIDATLEHSTTGLVQHTGWPHPDNRGMLEHVPTKWMPVGRKNVLQADNLEHFPAKWIPVGRRQVLKTNDLERRSDSIRSNSALDRPSDPQGSESGLEPSVRN